MALIDWITEYVQTYKYGILIGRCPIIISDHLKTRTFYGTRTQKCGWPRVIKSNDYKNMGHGHMWDNSTNYISPILHYCLKFLLIFYCKKTGTCSIKIFNRLTQNLINTLIIYLKSSYHDDGREYKFLEGGWITSLITMFICPNYIIFISLVWSFWKIKSGFVLIYVSYL